jgi:small ligand-binding sensory domain FIST
MLTAAVALAQEPSGSAAARSAVTAACADLGRPARVVLVFATHRHDPRAVLESARNATTAHILGCAASGVVAGELEVEDGPAIAAMALGTYDGDEETLSPFLGGGPAEVATLEDRGTAIIFADGYSRHPDELVREAESAWPGWSLAGAVTTGSEGAFPAYRWLDGELAATGLAGLLVGSPAVVGVTQACQPVGPVHEVTRASGRVIAEIDGRPAFEVFADRARPLLDDLGLAAQSILLAVPHDPEDSAVTVGFVVRGILQFDPDRGLLAVSSPLGEGMHFRFAVRDPWAARADLRRMVDDVERRLESRRPRLGFYFNGAGRGRSLYGIESHDIAFLRSSLGDMPLIGLFTGGEIGPAGVRASSSRLHLFSGVLAVIP